MNLVRIVRLLIGLMLFSVGIVLTINANLGIAPWDTFHQGISLIGNITFGQASIVVGMFIVLINILLKEHIGIGTILNIFIIGILIDVLFSLSIIPVMKSFSSGIAMIILGMITIALGSYFYIGAGYGAGPRDGLMVGITKKTGLPVGLVRGLIESMALLFGFLLGGKVGIGTIILALAIGPIVQFVFYHLKFDVKKVEHTYLYKSKSS